MLMNQMHSTWCCSGSRIQIIDLCHNVKIHPSRVLRSIGSFQEDIWLERWKSLEMQGEGVRNLCSPIYGKSSPASFTWLRKPWLVTDAEFSWAIRTHLALLPVKWNLFQWKKSSNKTCRHCKSRPESVSHALNGCHVQLKRGIYTKRHNMVLDTLEESCRNAKFDIAKECTVRADVISHGSSLRPDLQKYDDIKKTTLVDVKCPCPGQKYHSTHTSNLRKYKFFVHRAKKCNWNLTVNTFILSST